MTEGDVTRHNLQRRFLGQQSVATLLRHCFERLKRYSSIANCILPERSSLRIVPCNITLS